MLGPGTELPTSHPCLSIGEVAIHLQAFDEGLCGGAADVTGFQLWRPATLAAGRTLLEQVELVRGRSTLELGCGLGALGLFCARLGASSVVFTDRELAVLGLARGNAEANGVAARCDFVQVDFARGLPPFRSGAFELLAASDVLFLDGLACPLFATFEALLAPCQTPVAAVLGHEVRRAVYRGPDGFPKLEDEDSALALFLRQTEARADLRVGVRRGYRGCGEEEGQGSGCSIAAGLGGEAEAVAVLLRWEPSAAGLAPTAKRPRSAAGV